MDTLSSTTLIAGLPPSPAFVARADGGLAASFGAGTFLRTAGADALLPTGASPRTVAAWVQPVSMSGEGPLVSWGATGTAHANALMINSLYGFVGYAADCTIASTASVLLGAWSHVAFTYDGTTVVAYRNGIVRVGALRARWRCPAFCMYVSPLRFRIIGEEFLEKEEGAVEGRQSVIVSRNPTFATPAPLTTHVHTHTHTHTHTRTRARSQTVKSCAVTLATTASTQLSIGFGVDGWDAAAWLTGLVDDVRIYNRALSPVEIAAVFNTPSPTSSPTQTGTASSTNTGTASSTSTGTPSPTPTLPFVSSSFGLVHQFTFDQVRWSAGEKKGVRAGAAFVSLPRPTHMRA